MSGNHDDLYKEMGDIRQQLGELKGTVEAESRNAAQSRTEVLDGINRIDTRLRSNELKGARNGMLSGGAIALAWSLITDIVKGTPG